MRTRRLCGHVHPHSRAVDRDVATGRQNAEGLATCTAKTQDAADGSASHVVVYGAVPGVRMATVSTVREAICVSAWRL